MKFNLKALLRNTKVLYFVFGLALINFFTYIMHHKFDAILLFLVSGVLVRYLFSKNMIVILLASMLLTNVIMFFKGPVKEGLTTKKNKKGSEKEGMKHKKKKAEEEHFESRLEAANINEDENDVQDDAVFQDVMDGNKKVPKIDYASTLESAYDNLDKLLGSDAIRSMSEDTQRLAEKQKNLMGNIQKLEPMMQRAGDMISGLNIDGMGDMLKGLEGKMSMFSTTGKKVEAADE